MCFTHIIIIIHHSVGYLWMESGRLRWLSVCRLLELPKSFLQRGPQLRFSAPTRCFLPVAFLGSTFFSSFLVSSHCMHKIGFSAGSGIVQVCFGVELVAASRLQCNVWSNPWSFNFSHLFVLTDVSNVLTIGDNYETSVIFIISGYQYIASAAAFNFGYTFRANWFKNFVFVFLFSLWTASQFGATLSASSFSCIWRLNCDNDHVVRWVTSTEPEPIYNNWNTTVMPVGFRWILFALMLANLFLVCAWDYWVVNSLLYKVGGKFNLSPRDSVRADYIPPQLESQSAVNEKVSVVATSNATDVVWESVWLE